MQQHQVKSGFDFLLARDADQLAFLSRSIGDAPGIFACLAFQIRLGDGQASLYAVDGGQHIAAHGADAGIQIDYHRVVFLRGAEQALAFQQHLVVAVDQFGKTGICQAYIDRKYFVGVIRIVGIAGQELYQPELGAVFGTFLFVFRVFTQRQLGIAFQVGESGIALEGFQFLFRGSQFAVDDFDTFINKFRGLGSHFVFVIVGIPVVDFHQFVDEIHAALRMRALYRDLCDSGGFGSRLYAQCSPVSVCHTAGGRNRSHDFLRALDGCRVFGGKAERARRGGQQGGQLVELLFVFLFSYPEFHIQLVARLQGQVKTCGGGQFLSFFGGNPYFHRGTFVKFDVVETALCGIADVKIQFFHHFFDKRARLQDFYFIVKVIDGGIEAQVFQVAHAAACFAVLVIVLDDNGCRDVVHRRGITQIEPGSRHAQQGACHEPGPVDGVFEKNRFKIGLFFFFFQIEVVV